MTGAPAAIAVRRAAVLEPMARIEADGGSDERDAGGLAGGGEIGILAEEAVAGVDGVGAVAAGGVQNAVDAQVAFGGGAGADVRRLIGHADVERGAVGVGVDGDAGDAHLAEGADDADGDLAAIGDQDLAEHADGIVAGRPVRLTKPECDPDAPLPRYLLAARPRRPRLARSRWGGIAATAYWRSGIRR